MFRKNVSGQFIHFQGVDAATGGIKSGVTWTVRRCIDGTFAAATGTVTEDGTTGWYKFAMSQADTNGNNIGFNFTGTGAVPQTVNITTTAADPTDGVRFGLTSLPNAAAEAAGGLYTRGSGAGQINQAANGQIDINQVRVDNVALTAHASGKVPADVLNVAGTLQTAGDIIGDTNDIQARLPAALTAAGNIKADVEQWLAGVIPAPNVVGVPKVDLTDIDGLATNGNNATLNLRQLNIVSNIGHALVAQSIGGGGDGIYAQGHSSGSGIRGQGGLTGDGLLIASGAAGGIGVEISSDVSHGMTISGGALGLDIFGAADGIHIEGSGGLGLVVQGDNGDGALIQSIAGNGNGIHAIGQGTGKSISAPQGIVPDDGLNLSVTGIWHHLLTAITLAGSVGKLIKDFLDAAVSTRADTAVDVNRILDRVDYQRGNHTVAGATFYVDGMGGNDANPGTRALPKQTISGALALCTSNAHDEIILLPNAAGGPTTITESAAILITKNYVQIRGPGRDVNVTRSNNGDIFDIQAHGVELSGFRVTTFGGGGSNGVTVSSAKDFVRLHRLWIENAHQDAIQFNVATRGEVVRCVIVAAGRDGVRVSSGAGAGTHNVVTDCVIRDCLGSAVNLQGADSSDCRIQRNIIRDNVVGVTISAGTQDTVVCDNRFVNNTTTISDAGTNTLEEWNFLDTGTSGRVQITEAQIDQIVDETLDEDMTAHQTQGTLGQAIGDPVADTNTIYKAVVTDASGVTVGADTTAIKAKTDNLPIDPADESLLEAAIAGVQSDTDNIQTRLPAALTGAGNIKAEALVVSDKTGYAVTTTEHGLIADKLLGRNLAGGSDGGRTVQQAFRMLRNLRQIIAGILTVFREDDITPDWTASVTTTPGDPIDKIDPT